MNYYKNQLNRVNLYSEFPATIQIKDSEGNKTNCLDLNIESASVLIERLSDFIKNKSEGYKCTTNDDKCPF